MSTKDIKKLIEAFYEGETSIEEEKIIFDYFLNEPIAEELIEEQAFFLSLARSNESILVPKTTESKLISLIDTLDDKGKKKNNKVRNICIWVASAAACIAIIFSIGLQSNQNNNDNQIAIEAKDTFSDPNEAYREVEKALLLVSNNMNKGIEQLSIISNNIDKTNDIFNKSVNKINDKES